MHDLCVVISSGDVDTLAEPGYFHDSAEEPHALKTGGPIAAPAALAACPTVQKWRIATSVNCRTASVLSNQMSVAVGRTIS